jgi:UDP-N-acetylmuramate dehydrogenase
MITESVLDYIKQIVPAGDLLENEPMSRHTTFKVGGQTDLFINISNGEQLIRLIPFFRRLEIDFFVLGNGSNVLVGDRGYRGVILHIGDGMSKMTVKENLITAEAGALLSSVAEFAASSGLAGLEFASGIPGTIGGGIMMNAGAFGGEMALITDLVLIMNEAGEMMELSGEAMEFGYRMSVVKNRPYVVLSVTLRLTPGDQAEIKQKIDELTGKRREKQPLDFASGGSTFKRPKGNYAGKLIMDAGLRGFSIGGASVSEKHCGFVINRGNATAADILEVIKEVQDRVYDRFYVTLEPEVIYLGDF